MTYKTKKWIPSHLSRRKTKIGPRIKMFKALKPEPHWSLLLRWNTEVNL